MKISVNTIRFLNQHYNSAGEPAPNGVDDLAERIGAQLGAIEEVVSYGKRFDKVLVVQIASCVDHPNADRLHICMIDDGGVVDGVERDEHGYIQVVCGAPNVREGLKVAWLPPGATVPATYDKDPFVLEAREIRGQKSNGMLASPKELSISDSHEGILEITGDIAPGTLFAEAFNLNGDAVLDIENKMFTHRGYLSPSVQKP
jgi:phenylalanyl-tRNA synthetase beta chain